MLLYDFPYLGNFLNHNVLVLSGLRIRKMYGELRVCLLIMSFYKMCETGKIAVSKKYDFGFLALNNCSFLNTDPLSI